MVHMYLYIEIVLVGQQQPLGRGIQIYYRDSFLICKMSKCRQNGSGRMTRFRGPRKN